ncbi:MAG: phosphoglucomutase/phosphomannomutase family protein [Anaerolineales bacterium]|nr:MAG: phosphoglucomutase/phosphomannomutase family protein [Anaerolineales bacterium]
MAVKPIRFGTDGWRGRIADTYTFEAVRRCTHGFAEYLKAQNSQDLSVVIGFDMRFAGEEFAQTAAEVMAAHGFQVFLTDGPTPTPTISYSVLAKKARGAINITASHNPPGDNGFKVRDENGGAIDPEGLKQIEANIPDHDDQIPRIDFNAGLEIGSIEIFDPKPDYIAQIRHLIDLEPLRAAGLKILVDPMWGNGAGWFSELLAGGTTQVEEIHNTRNPIFPEMSRPEPIPPNVDAGLKAALSRNVDVLLITDGDADRVGLGDEQGQFVDQLRVFGLLAYYLLEVRGERGPIVKTLSTTSMLDKLGKLYNVPVYQTGVGFKYIAPKMLEVNALIGGEESGGYAFKGHVPERDGILAGLFLLDMMVRLGKKPSELVTLLFEKVGAHYYDRIDTPLSPDQREVHRTLVEAAHPTSIAGMKVIDILTVDGYKFTLEDGGSLLIRFSGTEPIVRVYCETTQADKVQAILHDGLKLVGIE